MINFIITRPHLLHIIKTNNAGLYFRNGAAHAYHKDIHRFKKVNNKIILFKKQADGKRNVPSTSPKCIREIPNCKLRPTQVGSFQNPLDLDVSSESVPLVLDKISKNYLNMFRYTNCIYCKYNTTIKMLLMIQKISRTDFTLSEMFDQRRTWMYPERDTYTNPSTDGMERNPIVHRQEDVIPGVF